MRRIEKVLGRSDDMIILRGVNVFPSQIEEALLATPWSAGHFQLHLTCDGRLDEMTVMAESKPEAWDGEGLRVHADQFVARIKNTIGVTTSMTIVAPGAIERSVGKAKRVFDKRTKP